MEFSSRPRAGRVVAGGRAVGRRRAATLPALIGAALLPLLGLLPGCGTRDAVPKQEPERPPPRPVATGGAAVLLTEAQSGRPVEMRADQRLDVRLAVQGTTRAAWSLVGLPSGVLRQVGAPRYEPDAVAAQYGEVAGTQVWRFAPTAPGQEELRFELRVPRSVEAPLATASYAVSVR